MHYTNDDLKKHEKLLRRLAHDNESGSAYAEVRTQLGKLNQKLTRQALTAIISPEKEEPGATLAIAKKLSVLVNQLFGEGNANRDFTFELGTLTTTERMLRLDPFQRIPIETRMLLKSNTSVFAAVTLLYVNGGCIKSAEIAQLLYHSAPVRTALGKASITFHLLQKHGLATRSRRQGVTFYTLTERGKLIIKR